MVGGSSDSMTVRSLTLGGMVAVVVVLLSVMSGVVGFVVGGGGEEDGGGVVITGPSDSADFGILDEIYNVIREDFVDQTAVDQQALRQGAIDGVIEALNDAHTIYIDPESYALGVDIISGEFQGIGARVRQDSTTGEIVIVAPFRDSPAELAGIRSGDVVLAVDGESTQGWSDDQAVRRIRGPEGTQVTLRVRHSNGETEDITVTRDTIVIPTVFTRPLEDADGNVVSDLAYVELEQITEKTVPDLRTTVADMSDQGYRGIVLDLRRNPGGSLSATIDVADLFLEDGRILTQVDREGNETTYDAHPGDAGEDIPLVILVGPGSASGAEVIAGALRDHQRAILVGETTFGKGSVNHLRELSDGGAIYITIARWLTPNGEQIEGIGLAPDIQVTPSEEDIEAERDVQLYRAIDYLRQEVQAGVP
jgi:carboxyl-terminal processing protease